MDTQLLQLIRSMAVSADWEVREGAADRIKSINDTRFIEYLPVWQRWVEDPNQNIRRAVEVGLLRIPKKHFQEAFELLIPLLSDSDPYVRKNCGPFALSAVAYRNPETAFKRFTELICSKDQNILWNIAMCLGVMFGVRWPEQSIGLLKILAQDDRRFVWRAAASSLIKLLRRYPHYKAEVFSWPNVDHVLEIVQKYTS